MSFHVDYKKSTSELCSIAVKHGCFRSKTRKMQLCHPYTLFYNSLFKDKRDHQLVIAELGIRDGATLLMWNEYFSRSMLYGFESNIQLVNAFENNFSNDRMKVNHIDAKNQSSIAQAFHAVGMQYDLIIGNSSPIFDDHIKIIRDAYSYLKPGGMLIIENVQNIYLEKDYIKELKSVLAMFQDYYFITMTHQNRISDNSKNSNNDKLFVLVKEGAEPIFKNKKKMTIITPSMRPNNLITVYDSINFDYVDEWIIVYDGSKISENPNLFAHAKNGKIKEYIHTSEGISGNPQRNYALDHVQNDDTYLYFVDDDNVIHQDLYQLLDILDDGKMYTFDQERRLNGDCIELGRIDTAMVLIDFKLCKDSRWILNEYAADFYFFNECYQKNKNHWIYFNNVFCTYNKLPR
ncbi:MAG: glycosyltransferase [Parachlamydiaceae bacterium]|nr:glycosyltransferase [Parachlamydiaceae bacterium]